VIQKKTFHQNAVHVSAMCGSIFKILSSANV